MLGDHREGWQSAAERVGLHPFEELKRYLALSNPKGNR